MNIAYIYIKWYTCNKKNRGITIGSFTLCDQTMAKNDSLSLFINEFGQEEYHEMVNFVLRGPHSI